MLDFRTCTWNRTILDILNACPAIRCSGGIFGLLPELADLDGTNTTETTTSLFCNGLSSCKKNGEANPYWERWPELRATSTHYDNEQMQQCRMFLGIGDGAAANCGSKCDAYSSSDGTRIAVTVGTSAAARVCLPLPIETSPSNKIVIPFGLFCYRIDKSQVLVGKLGLCADDELSLHSRYSIITIY
jgi:gluconokinase